MKIDPASSVRIRNLFIAAAVVVSACLFFLPLSGFWVYHEAQLRLNCDLRGSFVPSWISSSFTVRDVRLDWDQKIQVQSGEVKIDYDLPRLLLERKLRLRFYGENLPVKLAGEWARNGIVDETVFDYVRGDITVGQSGLEDIALLQAKSPEMAFQLGHSTAEA